MAMRAGAIASSGSTSSIRRIQRELKEISEDPSRHWIASPINDDMFEWQFAIRGPPGTDFQGGIYTGRLVLPVNYPLGPPSIMLLTPNGRFEVGKKICLSNSSYHPELWQPAWGIRTMMEALRSHFPMPGEGAIGALDWPSDLRKQLAKESLDFVCPPSKSPNRELLPVLTPEEEQEELPEYTHTGAAPAGQTEAAAADVPVPASPAGAQAQAPAPAEDALPEGLRFRGSPAAAPVPAQPLPAAPAAAAPAAQAPQPTPAPSAGASASASSADAGVEAGGSSRRRRRDDEEGAARNQRRQQPVLLQLLKPPTSRREWVLMVVDMLIFLAAVSFMVVLVDIFRNPPKLLNALPEQRDPQN